MKTPKQLDHQALVDFTKRWFALWNEADPHARSTQVADLWATAGAQVLVDPPQEVREAATALAFPVPRLEVRGHDEIDRRVTQAYAMFVQPGVHTFKAAGDASTSHRAEPRSSFSANHCPESES